MKEPFMGISSTCWRKPPLPSGQKATLFAQIHTPSLSMDAKALRTVPSHLTARRVKRKKTGC